MVLIMSNIKNISAFLQPAKVRLFIVLILTLFVAFYSFSASNVAYAADSAQCTIDNNTGQTTSDFAIKASSLVKEVITKVNIKLMAISQQMFTKIIDPTTSSFVLLLTATVTLFIIVYGILFVTGMAQIKFYDFTMIIIKLGIVFMLLSPSTWLFFNTTVIAFFNEGTIEIINYFTHTGNIPETIRDSAAGAATAQFAAGVTAFNAIDSALSKIFSSHMFVVLMAAFSSENYGLIMGPLIALSLWLFLMSLMTALWVYIMSLILKTLLFGLAPLFIITILFKRTRHLFDNWLNQIVSASLQPILLFIFFMFFVKLMENSVDNILSYPVCWTKLPNGWRGTPMDWYFWRFAEYKGATTAGGPSGWIPNPNPEKEFPIPIIHILTFLLVAELANRFNKVVIQIAMQISQANVNLAHEGAGMISQFTMAARRAKGIDVN
jgi:type IV secretory pathway VirB6-like protein